MRQFVRQFVAMGVWLAAFALVSSLPLRTVYAEEGKAATDDSARAKEHYKRAGKLYDLGKYDEAIKEFEAAFEIKDDAVFLYNIAQANRLANHYPEALRSYRAYLRRAPKAPNRADVELKISDMENLIAQAPSADPPSASKTTSATNSESAARASTSPSANTNVASNEHSATTPATETTTAAPTTTAPAPVAAATPDTTPKTKSAKPGNGKLFGGIVLAIVGAGAAGAGVYFGLSALSAANKQAANAAFDPALDSTGKTDQLVGFILDGAGGALAVTGVILAVLGARQNQQATTDKPNDRPAISFVPALSPGYAGAAMHLRF